MSKTHLPDTGISVALLMGRHRSHCFGAYDSLDFTSVSLKHLTGRVLETVHSAFSIHAIYYFVILNYFKPGTLAVAVW